MGIRRDEVISHPFSDELNSIGSISPERQSDISNSPILRQDGNYIEHQVSKMDTLAGIAIKYGVEIADIKRMNNLVNDLQMFALKSLQIPPPGRHTPSPVRSNVPNKNISRHRAAKSAPRKTTPAMSTLQRYYGLSPQTHKPDPTKDEKITEMSLLNNKSNTSLLLEGQNDKRGDSCMRRSRQNPEDSGGFPWNINVMGRGLFPRPKSSILNGDHFFDNGISFVRTSISTSSLSDALTRPFLEGLPKPISVWKNNKAALD